MARPLTRYDLDFLEGIPGAKQMVMDFLDAIARYPDHHDNRFYDSPVWEGNRTPTRTGTSYRLAEKRGISMLVNPRILPADITGQLLGRGWIEAYPQPHQYADNPKRFTDQALAWHEQFGGPEDRIVQRAIGRAIADAGPEGLPRAALEGIAQDLGVSPERVERLAKDAVDLNVIAQRADPPRLRLDTRAGRVWMLQEFGPLVDLPSELFHPPSEIPLAAVPSLVRSRESLPTAFGSDGPPDVFISYATEDQDDVARPLHDALVRAGLKVWYAPLTLRIGDSQRREIDRGIATSRFSIVVLSREYLAKGWTKYEFDGLILKNVAGDQGLLPIWHNISKQEVIDFSPSLADKVARKTADRTIQEIVDEIIGVIRAAS